MSGLVLVLLLASIAAFALVSMLPGDPVTHIVGDQATPERYAEVRDQLGLNDPVVPRYFKWLGNLLHGDLGSSVVPPKVGVWQQITAALPVSLQLAIMGMAVALIVSVPVALVAAHRPGGRFDRWSSAGAFAGLSLPSFLVGLLLILFFVRYTGWLPRLSWSRLTAKAGVWENIRHAIMPVLTIAIGEIAVFSRLLRDDLVRTLDSDFIASARTRGLSPTRVMVRHALRPSSFSFVTLAGVSFGRLIGSTVVVETLFGLPGLGTLLVRSASLGDVTTVQGVVVVVATIYVLINAVVDLLYAWLDPRLRRVG